MSSRMYIFIVHNKFDEFSKTITMEIFWSDNIFGRALALQFYCKCDVIKESYSRWNGNFLYEW